MKLPPALICMLSTPANVGIAITTATAMITIRRAIFAIVTAFIERKIAF